MVENTGSGGRIEAAVQQLRKMADDAPVISNFDEDDWERITERSYAELDGFIQRLELNADRSSYREFVYKLVVGAAVYNEQHERLQEIDNIADRVEFRIEMHHFVHQVIPAFHQDCNTYSEDPFTRLIWEQDKDENELRALFWKQELEKE